jgi:hypothetical protein
VEGRAPHARDDGITPTPMFPPFGHRPVANSSIIAYVRPDVARLASGLATRARRPRPSEKINPSRYPRVSPQGLSPRLSPRLTPPEGRAPHARKGHGLDRGMCPVGHRRNLQRMWWERNALAFVRPYHADAQSASLRENRPSPYPRRFPRKAVSPSDGPPVEGRAPHARKEGIALNRMSPLFGHHPLANPSVRVTCPGLRLARIRGRGDRAPPRKSPFPSSPGFPRKAFLASLGHLAEGRAPHARKDGITPTPMFPPFGHRPVANSSIIGTWLGSPPALPPGAETAPLRENRPSRYLRVCLARPSNLGSPPAEGRAPHARKDGTGLTEARDR